jgi:hypothetical protein
VPGSGLLRRPLRVRHEPRKTHGDSLSKASAGQCIISSSDPVKRGSETTQRLLGGGQRQRSQQFVSKLSTETLLQACSLPPLSHLKMTDPIRRAHFVEGGCRQSASASARSEPSCRRHEEDRLALAFGADPLGARRRPGHRGAISRVTDSAAQLVERVPCSDTLQIRSCARLATDSNPLSNHVWPKRLAYGMNGRLLVRWGSRARQSQTRNRPISPGKPPGKSSTRAVR